MPIAVLRSPHEQIEQPIRPATTVLWVADQLPGRHKLAPIADDLRQEGRLARVEPTVAAFTLLGSVMWIARWYRRDGRLSGPEVADEITAIALRGVLLDGGSVQKDDV